MAGRRYFGNVRKLPSGRYQARYTGPDASTYKAPVTFDTKGDADAWLSLRHSEILQGAWLPPTEEPRATPSPITFGEYAKAWLSQRDLAYTTDDHYRQLIRDHIRPTFGDMAVRDITPADVRVWYAGLSKATGPTARAHAYALLRTILMTAVADDVIGSNPCRVRGAGQSKRARKIRPATLAELEVIVANMPGPLKLMVLLASWCALRFGELAELRRGDVNVSGGVIHVRRGVTRRKERVVKGPKSEAGKRDVAIPPHLLPLVKAHLAEHAQVGRDGLLFPARNGEQISSSSVTGRFHAARKAAGRTDLRFHDMRHTGATLAAATGATLAELMARLGHSTVGAALRYQHAAADRDKVIADALSKLATGGVTPIDAAPSRRRKSNQARKIG